MTSKSSPARLVCSPRFSTLGRALTLRLPPHLITMPRFSSLSPLPTPQTALFWTRHPTSSPMSPRLATVVLELEILGNINLVASTPWAEATPLKGSFKYLNNADYVRGALACISSQAGRSFGVARSNVTMIQPSSGSVNEQGRVSVMRTSTSQLTKRHTRSE
jgi:hypothetical protein